MMTDDDIMFEIVISITRAGLVKMCRDTPNGVIFSDKVVALGMLEVAKSMVICELESGIQEQQP